MMVRNKIAAVSYLNTVPFIYGIEHAQNLRADLLLSPPSGCADSFAHGDAEIALVPVGALDALDDPKIITSYCIGAVSQVRTVVLMSNTPIDRITDIWLDSHSRTSVRLVKVLCSELWKISPRWHRLDDYSIIDAAIEDSAFLLIGDKVFDYEGKFRYVYDLAECWENHTGLPFVFAVWVATENVSQQRIDDLNNALTYGVEHIADAIRYCGHDDKLYAYQYLTENINYLLDDRKLRALQLFRHKCKACDPPSQPG